MDGMMIWLWLVFCGSLHMVEIFERNILCNLCANTAVEFISAGYCHTMTHYSYKCFMCTWFCSHTSHTVSGSVGSCGESGQ